ncbi:uncharacterized protein BT62DRAFT_1013550 [Guyanagaster necrorhizus]|uniref:Uncharacterized protein n=1 Tax=Guyanagaster necrorhizus TaxID=856835 RepID=A0A9P7VG27_9AGAR|nr:uncharacterized protein BT62DRAFT_1013550 [Guyanagaster necrorhizus MCA 3950]KAG7439740.1 hypothetical protein BT62DRAFT_1013550 [Guyanagaster necrorhizus MCA 3950]
MSLQVGINAKKLKRYTKRRVPTGGSIIECTKSRQDSVFPDPELQLPLISNIVLSPAGVSTFFWLADTTPILDMPVVESGVAGGVLDSIQIRPVENILTKDAVLQPRTSIIVNQAGGQHIACRHVREITYAQCIINALKLRQSQGWCTAKDEKRSVLYHQQPIHYIGYGVTTNITAFHERPTDFTRSPGVQFPYPNHIRKLLLLSRVGVALESATRARRKLIPLFMDELG